jgi:beta-glucosidase
VLYGKYNPGGKLPFTIGRNRDDYGADVIYEPNNGQFDAPQDNFEDTGVFLDYRHVSKAVHFWPASATIVAFQATS